MIYALYHTPEETLGLIKTCLDERRFRVAEYPVYEGGPVPSFLPAMSALIIMGGPMNVDETQLYPFLDAEVKLITQVVSAGRPVLGICLGAQLLAKALGARVYSSRVREVGWHRIELLPAARKDRLFFSAPGSFDVLQWHGDTFDLPEGAVHLVQSDRCANQAFRWGASAWGLQFHLEVTPEMVDDWVRAEGAIAYIRSAGEDPEELSEKAPAVFSGLRPVARQIFFSFLDLCDSGE
jgi:GMP synthase-like glutamine amidotransferase